MFKHNDNWNRRRVLQRGPNQGAPNQRRPKQGGSKQGNGAQQPQAGFTLVELLVVITIIGILIGLTMPAIMAAIENARRISCGNNMRQVVLAANQYEMQLKQYPLNWGVVPSSNVGTATARGTPSSGAGPSAVGVSWMTSLLPYIDNGPLFQQVMLGQALGYQDANGYSNITVLQTVIPTYLCPSDTQRGSIANSSFGTGSIAATTNYKACNGSNWGGSTIGGLPPVTWPVGRNCNSPDGLDHGNGVICRGGGTAAGGAPIVTCNMDIRDGASKTIFLGEAVPEWCGWSAWFWFDGVTATCGVPLNWTVPGYSLQSNWQDWQDTYSFMSRHKSGANFAGCDGSVHYVPNIIDLHVYQALATIDGNEAVVTGTDLSTLTANWPDALK